MELMFYDIICTLSQCLVRAKISLKIHSNWPSSCSLSSTATPEKSHFLAACKKIWSLLEWVCKCTRFYPVFLQFIWINQINKYVIDITPLRVLLKKLKKLHQNTISSIIVHEWFLPSGHSDIVTMLEWRRHRYRYDIANML